MDGPISPELCLFASFIAFLKTGSHYVAQVSPELTTLLPTAGIKGMCHQARAVLLFLDVNANRYSIHVLKKTAKGTENERLVEDTKVL